MGDTRIAEVQNMSFGTGGKLNKLLRTKQNKNNGLLVFNMYVSHQAELCWEYQDVGEEGSKLT